MYALLSGRAAPSFNLSGSNPTTAKSRVAPSGLPDLVGYRFTRLRMRRSCFCPKYRTNKYAEPRDIPHAHAFTRGLVEETREVRKASSLSG